MRTARAQTVSVTGTSGHLVTVEAEVTSGLPAMQFAGLPNTALRETRDRIRAAILNIGESWPDSNITVDLSPAILPKCGSAFDLAIAIAVLAANDDLPDLASNLVFLAELGLDGRLRPVTGVLPAVLAVAESELDTVIVAGGNHGEATLVPGVTVIAADGLGDIVTWLRDGPAPYVGLSTPSTELGAYFKVTCGSAMVARSPSTFSV